MVLLVALPFVLLVLGQGNDAVIRADKATNKGELAPFSNGTYMYVFQPNWQLTKDQTATALFRNMGCTMETTMTIMGLRGDLSGRSELACGVVQHRLISWSRKTEPDRPINSPCRNLRSIGSGQEDSTFNRYLIGRTASGIKPT